MRKHGLCCRPLSVRLYVRPSVTLVYCIHKAEDNVNFFLATSHIILVFLDPIAGTQFQGEPLQRGGGAQNTRGGKILRFSTEIAVYLGNGTR